MKSCRADGVATVCSAHGDRTQLMGHFVAFRLQPVPHPSTLIGKGDTPAEQLDSWHSLPAVSRRHAEVVKWQTH
jgi:pSer/pThr/pTyr-binding forkhead associated (FHA) protein